MQPMKPNIQLTVVDAENPHAFYAELLQRIGDATHYELDRSQVTAAAFEWVIVISGASAIVNIVRVIWEVLKERRKVEGHRIRVYLHVGCKPAWIESKDEKVIRKIAKDLTEHASSERARKEFERWLKEVTMGPWIKKGS